MTQNWKNKCHLIVLQGNLVVVDTQAEQDNQAGDTLAAAEGSPVQGSHLLRLEVGCGLVGLPRCHDTHLGEGWDGILHL